MSNVERLLSRSITGVSAARLIAHTRQPPKRKRQQTLAFLYGGVLPITPSAPS
jgi:hypothetical protein